MKFQAENNEKIRDFLDNLGIKVNVRSILRYPNGYNMAPKVSVHVTIVSLREDMRTSFVQVLQEISRVCSECYGQKCTIHIETI